jgi:hypothetical protein
MKTLAKGETLASIIDETRWAMRQAAKNVVKTKKPRKAKSWVEWAIIKTRVTVIE